VHHGGPPVDWLRARGRRALPIVVLNAVTSEYLERRKKIGL
jgi:hypothetical protein